MNEVTIVKLRLVLDILVSISFMILAILKYRVTLDVSDLILLWFDGGVQYVLWWAGVTGRRVTIINLYTTFKIFCSSFIITIIIINIITTNILLMTNYITIIIITDIITFIIITTTIIITIFIITIII